MTAVFKFNDRDWERIEKAWNAWWAGELQRPLVIIENPVRGRTHRELTHRFLAEDPIETVLDFFQARLERTAIYGDAWPKWFPFYGAGVVAAFLDAQLHCAPDTETIWFEPPPVGHRDAGVFKFDENNFWWQRVSALTQIAVDRWGSQVCLGITDLGGNLDILASLYGSQKLLFGFHDRPEKILRESLEISRLWLKFYNRLYEITSQTRRGSSPWAPIWAPGKCYMLQSDLSAMISPKMFERFVLPDLNRCCDALEYPFYHMDGVGQIPHLDHLLSIKRLRGVQWIPGAGQPDPEHWLALLQRIRQAGKLCQLFVSAEGARTIVRELGGKGFAFYITEALSKRDAQALIEEII